jgi:peptidoglycan/LPS O-acetylase OafA/YrhL
VTEQGPSVTTPRPATAPPRTDQHYDALDGVRAIAAFGVLVFHVAADTGNTLRQDPTAWLFSGGAIAVPVFFTLSGLLLYRPWVVHLLDVRDGRRVRVRAYLWRRALRILPAYWVVVAYVMAVILTSHIGDVWTWLKLLTLTYPYFPHPWWHTALGPQGLGQVWSLTVEVAWYAVLPITAALLGWYARLGEKGRPDAGRRTRRLLTALAVYAAVSFAFTVLMFKPHYAPQIGVWIPRYFAWFAIGMALAVVSVRARTGSAAAARFARTIARSRGTCWAIAAVLYCIAASPITGPSDLATFDTVWTSELRLLLYGLVAAFAVAPIALAAADDAVMRALLGNRVMRFLGRISYGVFLWQVAISAGWYDLTEHRPFTGHFLLEFPVIALLTVAVATVSFYLLERPVLRLASRRWRSG